MANATALLAELHPTNATEAVLAAQMVGTQRAAMKQTLTRQSPTIRPRRIPPPVVANSAAA